MQITVAVNGSAKNTNKKQRNTKHETTKNIADQWPHEVDGWIGGSTYASVPLSEVSWPPLWPLLLFPITIIIVITVIVITILIKNLTVKLSQGSTSRSTLPATTI